jgi:ribonuclease HI
VTFWHILEARNEARNTEAKPSPNRTSLKILAYVDLIQQHLFKPTQQRCVSTPSASWTPPPLGTVFVNSDAAIFEAAGCMGTGAIIRDHQGSCIAACRQHIQGVQQPECAEALALRRAVELARDKGFNKVIFASDCLSLIQRINSLTVDRSSVGLIISGIKLLARDFSSVSFCHVKRVLNEAAHILAKSCASVNSSCVFNSVPECIRETLCLDVV